MSSKNSRGDFPRWRRTVRKPRAPRILAWFEALEERRLLSGQYINHLSSDLLALSDTLSATSASRSSTSFQEGADLLQLPGRCRRQHHGPGCQRDPAGARGDLRVPARRIAAGRPTGQRLPAGQPACQRHQPGAAGPARRRRRLRAGTAQVGTFNDQAVNVLEADRVAATPATPSNITGAGVTVGVLSNSFNALGGASTDEADVDLPATVNVIQDDTTPGNVE